MFELHYEPLISDNTLNPWEIAIVPWDTETFGFGVSFLKIGFDTSAYSADALKSALKTYSYAKGIKVIITSIPAGQVQASLLLQQSGFFMIDMAFSVRYENLQDYSEKNIVGLSLSPTVPSEISILMDIAGVSFRHGRYHMDPCFPASLADQRFKDWISRCLNPQNPQRILTAKVNDAVCGFSVVECKDSLGYLHLHAIDPSWQGKKLGRQMILESLRYLYSMGAETVDTKISTSNLRVVNMHARLNGRFIAAERLLHWHQSE